MPWAATESGRVIERELCAESGEWLDYTTGQKSWHALIIFSTDDLIVCEMLKNEMNLDKT